jgi:hypothetical protein
MAQTCSICRHPRRDEVERSILGNIPYRRIAELFQVSISGLSRHKEHVPAALLGAARAARNEEESELSKATTAMLAEMRGFQKKLKRSGQRNTAATCDLLLKISREIRALLELRSRLVTPRMNQSQRSMPAQDQPDEDAAEITADEADRIAAKWLARRANRPGASTAVSTVGAESDVTQ